MRPKNRIDRAPQSIVEIALFGNPGSLPDSQFRTNRVLDAVKAVSAQYTGVQQFPAELDQPNCGCVSAQAYEVQIPVTLATGGVVPGRDFLLQSIPAAARALQAGSRRSILMAHSRVDKPCLPSTPEFQIRLDMPMERSRSF